MKMLKLVIAQSFGDTLTGLAGAKMGNGFTQLGFLFLSIEIFICW